MPTEAKDRVDQTGFFERIGRKADQAVSWIAKNINHARATYSSINSDYVKVIRSHKLSKILPPSLTLLTILFILMPFFAERILNNDIALWGNDTRSEASSTISPIALIEGEISQDVNCNGSCDEFANEISSIELPFGTYARLNTAEYEFILKKNNEIVHSQNFSAVFVKDNEYYNFKINPIKLNEGGQYSFTIRVLNSSDNNYLALFRDDKTNNIIFRLSGRSDFYYIVIAFTVILLVIFFIINILINSGKINNEFRFLACMLAYIVPLAFIYPVFTIPDEPYHFISAVRLTEYNWNESPSQNLSRTEHNLPSNSACLAAYYNSISTPNSSVMDEIITCFNPADNVTDTYIDASITSRILAYLPSALGVMFGGLVSDSPMIIFYFGRVFNLLITGIIIAYAISLIKKHRIILLAVIFIPMFLQQSVSYSYDGLLNALCILVVAYAIRFLTMGVNVRKRDILVLVLAITSIGIIKIPYILVAAPLLAVKSEKFGKRKINKWIIITALIAIAFLSYVLSARIESIGANSVSMLASSNPERGFPLMTLFTSPMSVIKMFLRTLWELKFFYITSTIGYFGWFYFSIDFALVIIYLIFLAIVVLSEYETKLKKLDRFWIILNMTVLIGSFFLVMYLQWTPRESHIIEGVQGRYFLPTIPLLMLSIIPRRKKLSLAPDTCYAFFNLITFIYLITLLVGFY